MTPKIIFEVKGSGREGSMSEGISVYSKGLQYPSIHGE